MICLAVMFFFVRLGNSLAQLIHFQIHIEKEIVQATHVLLGSYVHFCEIRKQFDIVNTFLKTDRKANIFGQRIFSYTTWRIGIACGLDFIYVYVCSRSFESQKFICLLLTYLFNIFISFYSLIYYSFFKGFHLLGKCNRRITDTCLTSLVSGFFC